MKVAHTERKEREIKKLIEINLNRQENRKRLVQGNAYTEREREREKERNIAIKLPKRKKAT